MIKKIFAIIFLFVSTSVFANPSPLSLEINKTTYKETKEKYSGVDTGINHYSSGKMYDLDVSNIDMDGLKSVKTIFSSDDRLLSVFLVFDQSRYSFFLNNLKKKYKLISSKDAFVGDKYAKFRDGDTEITISARHMSFTLEIRYTHDSFTKVFIEKSTREKKEKEDKEAGNL